MNVFTFHNDRIIYPKRRMFLGRAEENLLWVSTGRDNTAKTRVKCSHKVGSGMIYFRATDLSVAAKDRHVGGG